MTVYDLMTLLSGCPKNAPVFVGENEFGARVPGSVVIFNNGEAIAPKNPHDRLRIHTNNREEVYLGLAVRIR